MALHTPATVLAGQLTFFHPRHATWHINRTGKWISRNRKKYIPRVIFVDMQYVGMSGDTMEIAPIDPIDVGMKRDSVHFSLEKDHVRVRNLEFTVHDLRRAAARTEETAFWVRKMTDDDIFLVELRVASFSDGRFDIKDVRVFSPVDHCRFKDV